MHQPPRRPLLAALLACGLFLATAPWAGADDDKAPKAELDKKAPPIVMQDTAGRSFELHDAIPNAELCIVPGCAHNAHLERPDLFSSVVLDFLTSRG